MDIPKDDSLSQLVKSRGIKSLAELSRISFVSVDTLRNWHRSRLFVFEAVLALAVIKSRGD